MLALVPVLEGICIAAFPWMLPILLGLQCLLALALLFVRPTDGTGCGWAEDAASAVGLIEVFCAAFVPAALPQLGVLAEVVAILAVFLAGAEGRSGKRGGSPSGPCCRESAFAGAH
jgi:hypothetical protein